MDFDQLFSRVDEETLQNILGRPALRVITTLDSSLAIPSKLREIIVGLYTKEGMLAEPRIRSLLLDFLPEKDALTLASLLNIPTDNLFSRLQRISLRKGSDAERSLFNFFGLYPPVEESFTSIDSIEAIKPEKSLFFYQRNAALAVKDKLESGNRRVVLHMPTGAGKTRTAMHIIADHFRSSKSKIVVWLAYSEELCEQAVNEFKSIWQHLGDRELNVYRFWGANDIEIEQVHEGFFVAGLSKVYSRAKTDIRFISVLGGRCSLVIIDEAHQAVAETYSLILETLVVHNMKTGLLGLTATPGRTWLDIDEDERLADFFNRQKVTLSIDGYDSPITYLVAQGYLADVSFMPINYEGGVELTDADIRMLEKELEISPSILKRLAEQEKRTIAILLKIEELVKYHSRIIVFASTVEHSDLLAVTLRARGYNAQSITGQTQSSTRQRIINDYKDASPMPSILCNYGVLTAGFDAPRTSAAVIARPTKSLVLYSQMVGRAIRGSKSGGNDKAVIYTVIDTALPGFRCPADAFANWNDIWD